MRRLARAAGAFVIAGVRFIASPAAISAALLIAGVICTVTGIHALVGQGWAFVAAGIEFLLLAIALLRGLIRAG